MIPQKNQVLPLIDFAPEPTDLTQEALASLQEHPRKLPCKFFYDEIGSQLFEKICELDEYYLTRTEMRIMKEVLPEIARAVGPDTAIIEYGSGSGLKTELLLEALESPRLYAPVDISKTQLLDFADRIAQRFSRLPVQPICADYNHPFAPPGLLRETSRRIVYFPGSTLGNFDPPGAAQMLSRMKNLVGQEGAILLGLDLAKSPEIIEPAYNDSQGVTAAFNLNALKHINRVTGSDFDVSQFRHNAVYRPQHHRVEMHLVSSAPQKVRIGGQTILLDRGEAIVTEHSHKYPLKVFDTVLDSVGLRRTRTWLDPNGWFSIQFLESSRHTTMLEAT